MALEVPLTLAELRTLVTQAVRPTLSASNNELHQAINYGYGKAVRAIRSVRPHHFTSFVNNFSFTARTSEFDISAYFPPIWRLTKLVVPGTPATSDAAVIVFRYRDFRDPDYESREAGSPSSPGQVLYDVVEGGVPGVPTTVAVNATSLDSIEVASAAGLVVGSQIQIAGAGPTHTLDADDTDPDYELAADYMGTVAQLSGTTVTLSPRMGVKPTAGTVVTPLRRRVLMIVPAFSQTQTGRLWYSYNPIKLSQATHVVDPICSEHRDMIVAYAIGWLLRMHNDADGDRWFMDAQEMRSEMMQDIDPQADQQSDGMASGMLVGDW